MSPEYVLRRLVIFVIVLFTAATIIFFLPRISGQNPIRQRLLEEATRGGFLTSNLDETVRAFEAKYGLDKPIYVQYGTYLLNLLRGDLGTSIVNFPRTVNSLVADTLLWTLALGGISTIVGFVVGTYLGALIGWSRAKGYTKYAVMPLLTLSAVPYFMLGLVLLWFFAFLNPWFPPTGGYSIGATPDWSSLNFWLDVGYHSILPALSIVLANAGFWALGMRGMMVTTQGEDYMLLAEAKGLPGLRVFFRYAVRNALLPQTTALVLALGTIVSNIVLVEIVFGYPGIGGLLLQSIQQSDFPTLQGVVFIIILSIAIGTFILDMFYPFIDPRIRYSKA